MLNFAKPTPAAVEVEGQTVFVHPLTAGQLAQLLGTIETLKKSGEAHKADFALLFLTVKDAEGKPAFASAEEAMEIPPTVAAKLLPACLKINGMGQHDEKKD